MSFHSYTTIISENIEQNQHLKNNYCIYIYFIYKYYSSFTLRESKMKQSCEIGFFLLVVTAVQRAEGGGGTAEEASQ